MNKQKIFFNPVNMQSSSEDSLKEKRKTVIGMCFMQILNLCHRWQAYSQPSQITKIKSFVKIVHG